MFFVVGELAQNDVPGIYCHRIVLTKFLRFPTPRFVRMRLNATHDRSVFGRFGGAKPSSCDQSLPQPLQTVEEHIVFDSCCIATDQAGYTIGVASCISSSADIRQWNQLPGLSVVL